MRRFYSVIGDGTNHDNRHIPSLYWQSQQSDASRYAPVLERQGSAVPFGDLAAEDEADTTSGWFGREKGYEEVGGSSQARAFVLNAQRHLPRCQFPADANSAAGLSCRFDAVF